MRLPPSISILASLLVFGACGGVAAEAPLTLKLGIPRDQATTQLRSHQYCHTSDGPPKKVETYPRCKRAGTEWGESWVTARFEGDALVEVRRWERYADDNAAIERWNQLVADRLKISKDEPEALDALKARGPLESGTRTVKAFRVDANTIVAVYLLTPSPPEDASVLEAIVRVK